MVTIYHIAFDNYDAECILDGCRGKIPSKYAVKSE